MSLNKLLTDIRCMYHRNIDSTSDLLYEIGFREASKYFRRDIATEFKDLRLFIPLKPEHCETQLKIHLKDSNDYCTLDGGIIVPEIIAEVANLDIIKYEFEKENKRKIYNRAFAPDLNLFS